MEVSKRIDQIIKCVNYKKVGDIATDHCFIGIGVSKKKDVEKVIACDINLQPLKNGEKNIKKLGIKNIELRLGNGISPIKVNEVDSLIIAGIGGELMIQILKDGKDVLENIKQLILQPQSFHKEVKQYIHSIGFKINEEIIVNDNKFYVILDVVKGEEKYSESQYILGPNIKKNKDYEEYLRYKINRLDKLINNLENTKRTIEVENKINNYKIEKNIYDKGLV